MEAISWPMKSQKKSLLTFELCSDPGVHATTYSAKIIDRLLVSVFAHAVV